MLNAGQSTILDYVTLGKLDNQQLTKMWVSSVKQTMGWKMCECVIAFKVGSKASLYTFSTVH